MVRTSKLGVLGVLRVCNPRGRMITLLSGNEGTGSPMKRITGW